MTKQIENYLRALKRHLWLRGVFDPESLAEIESHLLESVEAGVRCGLSVDESVKQTLGRFGSVKVVSLAMAKERNNLMQKLLLGLAVLGGLFIAYVDSRPTWDDTGVVAISILLVSGLIELLGYRRPWLVALAVGLWIPLRGILVTQNYGSLLALVFAFAGAYGGWLVRLAVRKTLHPA